jgi:RNA polymerase sigma-70 factor (ECF subfamily)
VGDDDAELVERLRAGDEAAFRVLVGCYQGPLLRLAESLVSSRAVAEEVVQETWLGVVRGVGGFEGRASVKTWLFRILVNRARSAGAREFRSMPVDRGSEPAVPGARFNRAGEWSAPPVAWTDDVDERLDAKMLAGRIGSVLPTLPDGQRQVFLLRDVEGLGAGDVRHLLGVDDGSQRLLLHRARYRLRGMLENEMGRA